MEKDIKSESRFTFWEATGVIVGHGVGSGVLAVPYLASRNSIFDFIWIVIVVYLINLLLHYMIAELSYNNNGAQFIKCFENSLFVGRAKKVLTWIAFGFLGLSVLMNVSGFIVGAGAVLTTWFGLPSWLSMLIYYAFTAIVVFFGMKIVGICEKYSVFAMIAVIGILVVATFVSPLSELPSKYYSYTNIIALFSMVSFSLSAVMSVPQVVKGVNGDVKKIRGSIALGTGINIIIVIVITIITLLGAGNSITQNGAIVDLSAHLGGWVSIVGYVFTLLALSTSLWANTLNLRDIVHESTKINLKLSWLIASLPCFVVAILGISSFVGLTRIAGVIQVLTGLGIIIAYNMSRRKAKLEFGQSIISDKDYSPIIGVFGRLPFQIIVIISSLLSTIGSILTVV